MEDKIVRYSIDTNRSRLTIQVGVTGLFAAFAHDPKIAIRDFTGSVEFMPEMIEQSSLSFKIKADSLESIDDIETKYRKEIVRVTREEVLETSRYPYISFQSTNISGNKVGKGQYLIKIEGDLSLHGITRKCSIDTQVWFVHASLRAHGELRLLQTDYGIKLISAAAISSVTGGTIKVKDEVKFSFDIVAYEDK